MELSELINNKGLAFFAIIFALLIVLLILILRLIHLYKVVDKSFSKLSYAIREDSKKFFNASIEKSASLIEETEKQNKETIKQALCEILKSKEEIISDVMMSASKEADRLVLDARKDASQIIEKAQEESEIIKKKNLEKAAYILESVLSSYVAAEFKIHDHEKFINAAITNYLNDD